MKYDLRVYVLVTNYNPLKIYIYDDGLVRFATSKYSKDPKTLGNKYSHLTNFSINKKAPGFKQNNDKHHKKAQHNNDNGNNSDVNSEDEDVNPIGSETGSSSKWDFKQLAAYFEK